MTAQDEIRVSLDRIAATVDGMNLDTLAWDAGMERHETALDAACAARDLGALRAALSGYEDFARAQRAAWDRQCARCGRGPGPHKDPRVCAVYTPRVDVLGAVA